MENCVVEFEYVHFILLCLCKGYTVICNCKSVDLKNKMFNFDLHCRLSRNHSRCDFNVIIVKVNEFQLYDTS